MAYYYISKVKHDDKNTWKSIDMLLFSEGIRRDANLDYTCALFNRAGNVIGTGSCFGNTLRCLAVSRSHQGEGLTNRIISHLIEVQFLRGNTHLFLYTKCNTAKLLGTLGFYEILRIENQVVFMENRQKGFFHYLKRLESETRNFSHTNSQSSKPGTLSNDKTAAIVMNANPFTLGHQYLVEKASTENNTVHLFLLSEDVSAVPFTVRKKLVQEGTSHLPNVILHDSGPYIISNATFPSYFQKDEEAVIKSHASLDLEIFKRIAERLGITRRYVGEEQMSFVTGLYNQIMVENLPKAGVECVVVPRKKGNGEIISASLVRQAIKERNFSTVKNMVPESTFRYLMSKEAEPVKQWIYMSGNVIHY